MLDTVVDLCGVETPAKGLRDRPEISLEVMQLGRRIIAVTGLTFEARIVAGPDITVVCGGGRARLARSLDAAIREGCAGVLSFGVAGGLAPHLKPGSCVIVRHIIADGGRYATDPGWSRSLLDLALGAWPQRDPVKSRQLPDVCYADIVGSDVPLGCIRAKRGLHRATGAAAVDMESHVAARVAAEHGVPFAAFRVVTDPAHRALPPAALVATTADGVIDVGAVMRSLLRHPKQVPILVQLALDSWAARQALVRSRRLLGLGLGLPHLREGALDVV